MSTWMCKLVLQTFIYQFVVYNIFATLHTHQSRLQRFPGYDMILSNFQVVPTLCSNFDSECATVTRRWSLVSECPLHQNSEHTLVYWGIATILMWKSLTAFNILDKQCVLLLKSEWLLCFEIEYYFEVLRMSQTSSEHRTCFISRFNQTKNTMTFRDNAKQKKALSNLKTNVRMKRTDWHRDAIAGEEFFPSFFRRALSRQADVGSTI